MLSIVFLRANYAAGYFAIAIILGIIWLVNKIYQRYREDSDLD
jgi:hypothetical protein